MAYVTPNTVMYVLKGYPCENNYHHTLFFSTLDDQLTYMRSLIKYTVNYGTYQRVNKNMLRIAQPVENLYDCNYLMFQNTSYGSHWFFAFITDVTYINDHCSEITYELDVMQTWHFDYELRECYIDREHSASDNFGENLIDEELDTGEYILSNNPQNYNFASGDYLTIVISYVSVDKTISWNSLTNEYDVTAPQTPPISVSMQTSFPVGFHWEAIDYIKNNASSVNDAVTRLSKFIYKCTKESITMINMQVLPKGLVSHGNVWADPVADTWTLTEPTSFKANRSTFRYTPANKKLLQYPYNVLTVSDNSGNVIKYKWEYFSGTEGQAKLKVNGGFMPQGFMYLYPADYKGASYNYEDSLSITTFPTVSWSEDSFAKWWNVNKNTFAMGILTNAVQLGFGAAAFAAGGGVAAIPMAGATAAQLNQLAGSAGTLTAIGSQLAARKDAKAQPDIANGTITDDVNKVIDGRLGFTAYSYQITAERAEIIDNYFTMFGYKVNDVKVPNRNVRPHWTYTKTSGCKIVDTTNGGIGSGYATQIENIYDNGITFWKNGSEVGNYLLDNSLP